MKTLTNIPTTKANIVFESTGFNYDIKVEENNDGTENIIFDSMTDANKFEMILKSL